MSSPSSSESLHDLESLGRRALLGLSAALLIASETPAATGSPDKALPGPEFTPTLRWEFTVRIGWTTGRNPTGIYHSGQRIYNTVSDGEFSGPRLRGVVLPGGGDWATMNPPDARLDQPVAGRSILFDARYILRTDDGVHIYVNNRGGRFTGQSDPADEPKYPAYALSTPMFDVPASSRYAFLARGVYVGLSIARPTDTLLQVYRVAS